MPLKTSAKRLLPGNDLKGELESLARDENLGAGVLLSLVGSLTKARLRLAGGNDFLDLAGPLEIVSATGTLSRHKVHIHIAVATETGEVRGGHLGSGCVVNTTAEVVILNLSDEYLFTYEQDGQTGYPELKPLRTGE